MGVPTKGELEFNMSAQSGKSVGLTNRREAQVGEFLGFWRLHQ